MIFFSCIILKKESWTTNVLNLISHLVDGRRRDCEYSKYEARSTSTIKNNYSQPVGTTVESTGTYSQPVGTTVESTGTYWTSKTTGIDVNILMKFDR